MDMKPYYQDLSVDIYQGDCVQIMDALPPGIVRTCVTSPPYWGLRDYGVEGQLGLEKTPEEYIENMVKVFRAVHRLLTDDGTLWINMGDSYAQNNGSGTFSPGDKQASNAGSLLDKPRKPRDSGLKAKDIVGMPWKLAFALQGDGWYLRQDIIWSKTNVMPESVTDRCTKSHEYIFLLAKEKKYYYDSESIKEKAVGDVMANGFRGGAYTPDGLFKNSDDGKRKTRGNIKTPSGWNTGPGSHRDLIGRYAKGKHETHGAPQDSGRRIVENVKKARQEGAAHDSPFGGMRNKRSVWTVSPKPFAEAHFATYPPDLIKPCILAGSAKGDTVLDPFMGAGTTAYVSKELGRRSLGCELNPEYIDIAAKRLVQEVLGL